MTAERSIPRTIARRTLFTLPAAVGLAVSAAPALATDTPPVPPSTASEPECLADLLAGDAAWR